ncbi:MAG: UDP-3-O-(3-hydroxymyristoyl)glucosamine N-acyltransferase, partial [Candidatus Pelagibacter sp.]|nr:UDP-3-O-(3-hydroxymyristoyl)glucosamine N-acyltransferase [Candidatus Pelagibacter sp.]
MKIKIINLKKGKNCKIIEPVNIYGATLGDNVFVGPFVEIQKNVFIDNNSRIQSHSFLCEKVKIGKNCFIGHGVMFIND